MQGAGPNPKTGITTTHHSRHSTRPLSKRKGDTTRKTGRPATQPLFTHYATHHPLCHPPFTMPPPSTTKRGEWTEDTPPHEQHRHTLTPSTPQQDQTGSSARYDSSTRQHRSGMSGARATPLHWAGQQQHAPPPFHTPRRMDTIYSSTHHSHSFVFTHLTNNNDQ